jgi:predicted PurR-regulated permease PerM
MNSKYPFYIRSTVILLGLTLIVFILFELRDILIPLSLAIMMAILLNPFVTRLQKWGVPHMLSIIIALTTATVVFLGLGYFLASQVVSFGDDLPMLKEKVSGLFSSLQGSLHDHLGVSIKQQNKWLNETQSDINPVIGKLMGNVFGIFSVALLLPIFTLLLIYYKKLILNFLFESFSETNANNISEVLVKTKSAIQNYMVGLLIEGVIVAALNSAALLILGVKYAILLGVIGAIVNILPFIGGVLAIIFPVIIATITKDGIQTQLLVIVAYIIIQFTDNHVLIPFIVSSKVRINALLSIIVVLLGGILWGIAGMFLAIPFVGVLKIIFDRVDGLKPWGRLLGNEIPVYQKREMLKSRLKRKPAHNL